MSHLLYVNAPDDPKRLLWKNLVGILLIGRVQSDIVLISIECRNFAYEHFVAFSLVARIAVACTVHIAVMRLREHGFRSPTHCRRSRQSCVPSA